MLGIRSGSIAFLREVRVMEKTLIRLIPIRVVAREDATEQTVYAPVDSEKYQVCVAAIAENIVTTKCSA
jgi:hypothetical protein